MNRHFPRFLLYAGAPLVLAFSLFIGPSEGNGLTNFIAWIANRMSSEESRLFSAIMWDIRLPRILLVFMVGAVLSLCGGAFQAVFRNPLVSPYVLGLSSGAAFGAALALAVPFLPVYGSAFLFGSVAVALSYFLARFKHNVSVISLILAGIIVNGVFTALLTIVQFLSDPFRLQTIVHWTMGNFHNANWNSVRSLAIPAIAGSVIILLMRWRMNVLALGDEEARAAGSNPAREKGIILAAATLAASAAVAAAGIIGLYGLIVPHLVRMVAGADNRRTMPLNAVVGGWFLVLVDDISRTVSGQEIPIGVFTMLIGAPVFVFLMRKNHVGWEE